MSRSYKHSPWVKERNKRDQKHEASKRVRHADELPDRMGYKRLYESWDISDFEFRETWSEYLHDFVKLYGEPTEEEENKLRDEWEKMFLRK